MSEETEAFRPITAGTVTLAVTTASGRVALASGGAPQYRIYNAGAAMAFFEFGGSTVAALAASGVPIPPGAIEVFRAADPNSTHIAALTSTGATTLYITGGEGI